MEKFSATKYNNRMLKDLGFDPKMFTIGSMFAMNEHFDLNIIDKDFKGETYEEYLGI